MRRLTLWILGSSIVLATGLFQLKHQVVRMEDQLIQIIHEISEENKNLHILEAEWGHLSNPVYLQKLVEKYLPSWHPLHSTQLIPLKAVPFREHALSLPDSLFQSLRGGVN